MSIDSILNTSPNLVASLTVRFTSKYRTTEADLHSSPCLSMEASKLSSCKLPRRLTSPCCGKRSQSTVVVRANHRDHWGRSVDEGMIVLRLRIKEMKMMEMNQELPSDWMKWEKQYFSHYHEDVYEAVGLLQSYLMSVRPSVALGTIALLALSVPMSSGVVLVHVLEMAKRILPCFGFVLRG